MKRTVPSYAMSEPHATVPQKRQRSTFRIGLIAALIAAFVAYLAASTADQMTTQRMHTMPDGSVMPVEEMPSRGSK